MSKSVLLFGAFVALVMGLMVISAHQTPKDGVIVVTNGTVYNYPGLVTIDESYEFEGSTTITITVKGR